MKIQNCIFINIERRHRQTDKPKAICPLNFSKIGDISIMPLQIFQSWGHKKLKILQFMDFLCSDKKL